MTLACRLLTASNLAYAISDDGKSFVSSKSFNAKKVIKDLGFIKPPQIYQSPENDGIDACYFAETQTEAFLVFRGTMPPTDINNGNDFLRVVMDWLNDAELEQRVGENLPGKVHKGFLDSLNNLWTGIQAFDLPKVIQTPKQLYITGHSKGGGLAFLAAARLLKEKVTAAGVYTYAAPRVGNQQFALGYDSQLGALTNRFEFQDDIVPHLPIQTGLWLHTLLNTQQLTGKLSGLLNINHLAINKNFDALLGRLQQIQKQIADHTLILENYVSVGNLQFINWDTPATIEHDSESLKLEREFSLAKMFLTLQFERIIEDHSSSEGSGYMNALCGPDPK